MKDYAEDKYGNHVYPGDYVQCECTEGLPLANFMSRSRVTKVQGTTLTLYNGIHYPAKYFRLAGRYHPAHHNGVDKRRPRGKYLTNSEMSATLDSLAKKEEKMLHIAIRVEESQNYTSIANNINGHETFQIMAETSADALKERIRARIKANSEERWVILSGNTIAESSVPPVIFRAW